MEIVTRTSPVSWEQLQTFDCSVITVQLGRTEAVARQYAEDRKRPNFRQQSITRIKSDLNESECGICLQDNDYPYMLEKGVVHCVLWFNKSSTMELDVAKYWVAGYLKTAGATELSVDQIVLCCNPPEYKTIPEIEHYHVFIRGQA
jgi:hypothetical protein